MTMPERPVSVYCHSFVVPADKTALDGMFYYQVTRRSPLRGPFTTRLEALADAYFWSNPDQKLYPDEEKQP
jgi:hypothetical protein